MSTRFRNLKWLWVIQFHIVLVKLVTCKEAWRTSGISDKNWRSKCCSFKWYNAFAAMTSDRRERRAPFEKADRSRSVDSYFLRPLGNKRNRRWEVVFEAHPIALSFRVGLFSYARLFLTSRVVSRMRLRVKFDPGSEGDGEMYGRGHWIFFIAIWFPVSSECQARNESLEWEQQNNGSQAG